jgi:copper(I)-binding protein
MSIQNNLYKILLISFITLFFLSCTKQTSNTSLSISQAYAKFPIEGQLSTAAYMTISNFSTQNLQIISVRCSGVESSIFHNTVLNSDNQMITMMMEKVLNIGSGQEIYLTEGGRHLMLMGLNLDSFKKGYILCNFFINQEEFFPFKIILR